MKVESGKIIIMRSDIIMDIKINMRYKVRSAFKDEHLSCLQIRDHDVKSMPT